MKTGLLLISSYRRAMAALYGLLARRWKTSFYLYLAALFTLFAVADAAFLHRTTNMRQAAFDAMVRWRVVVPKPDPDIVIVDMHAEATSEAQAMGWYLDGRVTAVLGTHTHVPTLDAKVLPGGTAYVTDIGMTGPYDGVIGMRKEASLSRFLRVKGEKWDVAEGDPQLHAMLVVTEGKKAVSIQRIVKTLP